MLLSIVLPCYNEELGIQDTLDILTEKLSQYHITNYEIIVVNDGSKDQSLAILKTYAHKDNRIKLVSFSANRGQQMAVYAGLCYSSGEAVVLMDADLQDPPDYIPQMIEIWKAGSAVVYGHRAIRKGETILKKLTAYLFYRIFNKYAYTIIPKDVGDFRLIDRAVVDAFINMKERHRFNRALISWLGFKQTELIFEREERVAGETKWGWENLLNLAKDAIFSFSFAPILFVQLVGLFSIIVSFLILIYVFISKFSGIATSGWSSLMIMLIFFSGMILCSLGIIGEYLIRIYTEVLDRPMFIPEETVNLKGKELPTHIATFISKHNSKIQ